MPFRSEAQRRFLWTEHPDIAKRWAHEYPGRKELPRHKKRKSKRKAKRGLTRKGSPRYHAKRSRRSTRRRSRR